MLFDMLHSKINQIYYLYRLNITAPYELLDKSFGLSLSDQYWLKPEGSNISYDSINFFDHDFDYAEFMEASLSTNSNTTGGMLRKAWIIDMLRDIY